MKEKIVNLKKINDFTWEIPKENGMNVPGRIFASEALLEKIKNDFTFEQVKNVAKLPGIVGYSLAMSDAHQGYGMCVGGVAAFDIKKGIISPGAVGYDINCGVRLLSTNLTKKEFMLKRNVLMKEIYKSVPSGVGKKSEFKIEYKEISNIIKEGISWAISKGYGNEEDRLFCENEGKISGADYKKISQKALGRGMNQLGTLGAGNHFLEVQEVEEIYDESAAKLLGIEKGKVAIMIHSGSRGIGHQVASDYIKKMEDEYGYKHLPDRELAYAPIDSSLGKDYLSAMAGAANFGFTNRHIIMCKLRESFKKFFPKSELKLVYDIAHNIAKFEKHSVNGKKIEVLVHRKGATRSFGPESEEIPVKYRSIGTPIFIPGSMGTSSYVLVGTKKAQELSLGSTAHGAGRIMSRSEASKTISSKELKNELDKKDIVLESGSLSGAVDEAPKAYKDVEEVVRVSHELGIGKMVAKLKPLGVVKG
ncbi:RtcB family protein [Candidatus Pacearchaeota archaeon]|nr:RtcB family protein [Candidatus Pacearchaeota archaeon]